MTLSNVVTVGSSMRGSVRHHAHHVIGYTSDDPPAEILCPGHSVTGEQTAGRGRVRIFGRPVAAMGDSGTTDCACDGQGYVIQSGSTHVRVEGKGLVRVGDYVEIHGAGEGQMVTGACKVRCEGATISGRSEGEQTQKDLLVSALLAGDEGALDAAWAAMKGPDGKLTEAARGSLLATLNRLAREKWSESPGGDPNSRMEALTRLTAMARQAGEDTAAMDEEIAGGDKEGRDWLMPKPVNLLVEYWRERASLGQADADKWAPTNLTPYQQLLTRAENQALLAAAGTFAEDYKAQLDWAGSIHTWFEKLEGAKIDWWKAYLSGAPTDSAAAAAGEARGKLGSLAPGPYARAIWESKNDETHVRWKVDASNQDLVDRFQVDYKDYWEDVVALEPDASREREAIQSMYSEISRDSEPAQVISKRYIEQIRLKYAEDWARSRSGDEQMQKVALERLAWWEEHVGATLAAQWKAACEGTGASGSVETELQMAVGEYQEIRPIIPYTLGGAGNKMTAAAYRDWVAAHPGQTPPGIDCSGYVLQLIKRVSELKGWADPEPHVRDQKGLPDQQLVAGCPTVDIRSAIPGDMFDWAERDQDGVERGVHIMIITARSDRPDGSIEFGITDSSDTAKWGEQRGPKQGTFTLPASKAAIADGTLDLPGYGSTSKHLSNYPYKLYRPTYWLVTKPGTVPNFAGDPETRYDSSYACTALKHPLFKELATGALNHEECERVVRQYFPKYLDVMRPTFDMEGYPWLRTVTGDHDGQVVSAGIIQWNLGQSTLQPLLREMAKERQSLWEKIFRGTRASDLLSNLDNIEALRPMITDKTHYMWPDWAIDFDMLVATREFQDIQMKHLTDPGGFWLEAQDYAREWGFTTRRGLAEVFNAHVQCGWFKTSPKDPDTWRAMEVWQEKTGLAYSDSATLTEYLDKCRDKIRSWPDTEKIKVFRAVFSQQVDPKSEQDVWDRATRILEATYLNDEPWE